MFSSSRSFLSPQQVLLLEYMQYRGQVGYKTPFPSYLEFYLLIYLPLGFQSAVLLNRFPPSISNIWASSQGFLKISENFHGFKFKAPRVLSLFHLPRHPRRWSSTPFPVSTRNLFLQSMLFESLYQSSEDCRTQFLGFHHLLCLPLLFSSPGSPFP